MTAMSPTTIEAPHFREVLGHYPTGVALVTAIADDEEPIGMVVGTFSSVSMDPPLVSFMPTRGSYTFERLRTASCFTVNILAHDQEDLCRQFARRGADKFAGVDWRASQNGSPVLEGVVASVDCDFHEVLEAGDHYIVLGRVTALEVQRPVVPLLFFQGGYGGFTPGSLMMPAEKDLAQAMELAQAAREGMELLAEGLGAEVTAFARVGGHVATVATVAGEGVDPRAVLGSRFPLLPPLGELFVAGNHDEVEAWLARDPGLDEATKEFYRARVARTHQDGWAFTVSPDRSDSPDPVMDAVRRYNDPHLTPAGQREVVSTLRSSLARYAETDLAPEGRYDIESIVAPVASPSNPVQLVLRLTQLPQATSGAEVLDWVHHLLQTAAEAADALAARS